MSKAKKAIVAVILAATLAAGAKVGKDRYDDHKAGLPVLVGRCFDTKDGGGIMIPKVVTGMDPVTGEKREAYLAIIMMGPFQVPNHLNIRKANKLFAELIAQKKVQEVNCETGQPIDSK